LHAVFNRLVWKRLVGAPLSLEDIRDVDVDAYHLISSVASWVPPHVATGATAASAFDAAFPQLTLSAVSVDGRVVELAPSGSVTRVTLETRALWLQLQVQYRLTAYDAQINAMQRGLFGSVPARAVRLLTWSELEVAVSGRAAIDIKILRAHTGAFSRGFCLIFLLLGA
jgi:hypothetical protein